MSHLALCCQPTGAQVQLLVGLTQLLALHLQLCPLQFQPRQAAPQFPTFTLELPSLARHLSQQLLSSLEAKTTALQEPGGPHPRSGDEAEHTVGSD